MLSAFKQFLANQDGATAVEYGLLAAAIGLTIVAAASPLGDLISDIFGKVSDALPG